jgi:hypothetical protein
VRVIGNCGLSPIGLMKLTAELSAKYSGSKLPAAILEKITAKIDKPRFVFESGACFVAGTLVHTKEGLVPIEKLKIGDLVLSKPENGEGERVYKRVVNTFVHHDKEINEIAYRRNVDGHQWLREGEQLFKVTSTLDHPFWVEGEGWTAANRLTGWAGRSRLQVLDGSPAEVYDSSSIYATDRPGIGWIAVRGKESLGIVWDYDNNQLINGVQDDQGYDWENWPLSEKDEDLYRPFKTTVYNIEVEDYHTYFVGELGVWVHNANCDGVKLRILAKGVRSSYVAIHHNFMLYF